MIDRGKIYGIQSLRRELEVSHDILIRWMAIYNFPKPENGSKRFQTRVWSKAKIIDWVWQNQTIVDKYWAKFKSEDEC